MHFFRWLIRLGDLNIKSAEDDHSVQERSIIDVFIHPKYESPKAYFDVGLVEIAPVQYSPAITPICLPSEPNEDVNRFKQVGANVAGWGVFNLSGVASPNLKTAILNIYSNRYSSNNYSMLWNLNKRHQSKFEGNINLFPFF